MAFLPRYEDDELNQAAGAPGAPQGFQPLAAAGAAPTQVSTPAATAPSGTFINFDQYLNANRDAATRSANEMAGRLQRQAQGAQQGLGGMYGKFKGQMQAGSLAGPESGATVRGQSSITTQGQTRYGASTPTAEEQEGQDEAEEARRGSRPGGRSTRPTSTGSTRSTPPPTGPTVTVQEATQRAGQKYTGPESMDTLEGYEKLQAETKAAQDAIDATGQEGGLEALLREQYGRGGYTQGQSMMDAALLGRQGGSKFAGLRKQYGGIGKELEQTSKEAALQAGSAKASTAGAAAEYAKMLADREAKLKEQRDAQKTPADPYAKKKSYEQYTTPEPGQVGYDVQRGLRPDAWLTNGLGVRNPLDDFAYEAWKKASGDAGATNYQSLIRWETDLPPGRNSDKWARWAYEHMSQSDLEDVEKMSPGDRRAYFANLLQSIGAPP